MYNPQREVFRLSEKGLAPSIRVCFSVCLSNQQQTRKKSILFYGVKVSFCLNVCFYICYTMSFCLKENTFKFEPSIVLTADLQ
jgi:hypothetical protein